MLPRRAMMFCLQPCYFARLLLDKVDAGSAHQEKTERYSKTIGVVNPMNPIFKALQLLSYFLGKRAGKAQKIRRPEHSKVYRFLCKIQTLAKIAISKILNANSKIKTADFGFWVRQPESGIRFGPSSKCLMMAWAIRFPSGPSILVQPLDVEIGILRI